MLPSKAQACPAAGRPPGPHGTARPGAADHAHPADSSPVRGVRPEGSAGTARAADGSGPRATNGDVADLVGAVLSEILGDVTARAETLDPVFARDIAERVARFTLNGGKRTRSRFVWWARLACGGHGTGAEAALRIGAALELIQTCALVHDDVMDGSSIRRGRLALHADVAAQYRGEDAPGAPRAERFGEAAAILAGDLALAWADDVVAGTPLPDGTAQRVREVWSAMRMEMVAGQYLDVQGQATSSLSLARSIRAACLKTALYSVERPLALGAALAGADDATTAALCSAGRCVGIAFQLRDDLQGVFGTPETTGKPVGDDIRSNRPTYLVAVARARAEANADDRALAVLDGALGRADLSEAGLDRVREVLLSTGAYATVEAKIDRLVAQGMRHLDGAVLEPEGRRRLRGLLRAAAAPPPGAPPGPRSPGAPDHGGVTALVDALVDVPAEEATR
ncbi:polyprenyl synthetase family protein [Streptomyces sp. NPDC048566]|uniref:polyprenyl synthetase family protein n=1 Tax=Streptomyces sp. NPDC048566 TaxID=3365569 RepID=UPI00371E03ED